MKKILFSFLAAISIAATANAQLTSGTLFPYPGGATGELTAVNAPYIGQQFNLDSISNAGYTIFLDVSATWCHPCWLYHEGGALDSIWAQHGPTGAPGVDASTTNDVFVIFVQGESTSHLDELYGVIPPATAGSASVETPYSTCTQGNWVAGTPFPIIDDTTSTDPTYGTNALLGLWHIAYFPTVYMICRNKLVTVLTQPTPAQAYAAVQASCPTTAPATGSGVDIAATPYTGSAFFVCSANPTVSFQNYSTTSSITSATVTVTDGSGSPVATYPWTGSLAPFNIQQVSIPSFAGTSFGGYKYSVNTTGDIYAGNNNSPDSEFVVYAASNVGTVPFYDDLGLTSAISTKYTFPSDYSIDLANPAWGGAPNPAGVTTNKLLLFDFPGFSAGSGIFDLPIDNFNTSTDSDLAFSFYEAYQIYGTSSTDKMSFVVSGDCGATWTTLWQAAGASLATVPAGTPSGGYVPTGASDWVLRTVDIPVANIGPDMVIKFTGYSGGDDYGWVTDLKLAPAPLSVATVKTADFISVTPNPARDMAYVNITLNVPTTVNIQVYDAVGRVVNTTNNEFSSGDQKIAISTSDLAPGLYYVKITAGSSITTQPLSVVK